MEQFLNEVGSGISASRAVSALMATFNVSKVTAYIEYKKWRNKYVRTETHLESDQPRFKTKRNRYTDEQRNEMLRLRESGVRCEEIAQMYGVSRECVYYQLVRAKEMRKAGDKNE